jgi:hypothetical protein
MGGATAPKVAQKRRKSANEHRILNAKPISPEFLAAAIRELATKFSPSSAILAITVIVAAIVAIFPSVAGNPVNPATTTDSGKICHHLQKVRQGLSQVQDLRIPKHCRLSGLSCQSREGQPWSSRLRSKEAITSGL